MVKQDKWNNRNYRSILYFDCTRKIRKGSENKIVWETVYRPELTKASAHWRCVRLSVWPIHLSWSYPIFSFTHFLSLSFLYNQNTKLTNNSYFFDYPVWPYPLHSTAFWIPLLHCVFNGQWAYNQKRNHIVWPSWRERYSEA